MMRLKSKYAKKIMEGDSMKKLKYKQLVSASITRIRDKENDEFHFVRNETKITFGKGGNLLGSVIMTNPGSFSFKGDSEWNKFIIGIGPDTFNKSDGHPDPTMINIIKSIEDAYEQINTKVPDGYIKIYNLSSARCPKASEAEACHQSIKNVMCSTSINMALLEDPIVCDEGKFIEMCKESPFVIMGFIKNTFMNKANLIKSWENNANIKNIVQAKNDKGWPIHPICWIKLKGKMYYNDVVNQIKQII